jgi:acetolactate synthase I/II/III large subunit
VTATALRTPSQLVVDSLLRHDVDLFFGLDGDHVVPLFNALADAPQLRPITVRHENNAAIAAEVYARLTGRPGVCITTAGPGALNAIAGIAGAYAAGVPVVHISGGVQQDAPKEAFHGVDDTDVLKRAFAPVTKWSERIEDPRDIPAAIDRAFAIATSGRPGPTHLEIAISALQMDPIEPTPSNPQSAIRNPQSDYGDLRPLIERIDRAGSIAIVAGKGAWWPSVSNQLVRLAERLGAPVAHTWDGQAAMPTVHPLSIGPWGPSTGSHPLAAQAIAEADLVLGIGVRADTGPAQELLKEAGDRALLINATDGEEEDFCVGSLGALVAALDALAEGCEPNEASDATLARCARAQHLLKRGLAIDLERHAAARPWHIGLALDALGKQMTPETVVIGEVSNVKLWMPLQLPIHTPLSHLQPGSWGAMGYAVPGALAAGLVFPDRPVVAVTGDTSFLMGSSDFSTICQLGLKVVVAVHNDGQIGMINNAMTTIFGRPYATEIGQFDYVKYAEAFGARGIRVDDPADLDAAWSDALAAAQHGPVLLELMAGYEFPRPWPVSRLIAQAEAEESGR